mmetsp:Transcript_4395/g.8939  ORF Transcript_4395/g.8939 Transcript_4395/m.8939 type:complete len:230 (-) Transcript_4395:3258-3947(-)
MAFLNRRGASWHEKQVLQQNGRRKREGLLNVVCHAFVRLVFALRRRPTMYSHVSARVLFSSFILYLPASCFHSSILQMRRERPDNRVVFSRIWMIHLSLFASANASTSSCPISSTSSDTSVGTPACHSDPTRPSLSVWASTPTLCTHTSATWCISSSPGEALGAFWAAVCGTNMSNLSMATLRPIAVGGSAPSHASRRCCSDVNKEENFLYASFRCRSYLPPTIMHASE